MFWAPLLPEFVVGTGAIVLMLVAAFVRRSGAITSGGAVAVLCAATVMLIGAPQTTGPLFGGLLAEDGFAAFGKLLIFLGAAVAIVGAHGWFAEMAGGDGRASGNVAEHGAEYPVLILFSAVGMAVMVSATSLITLYVGLELQSLAAYVLASYRLTDARSAEAGLKYFVLGSLASGILLYGISLLYGFTGTTDFSGIAAAFTREGPHSLGLLFGLVFLLAGIAFKISAVPFHMWTPDVYEGAPTPVTAFFASAPKVAAVLLATRICFGALGPAIDAWRQIVTVVALGSIFLGAIAAFGQMNIKRLLAYSSINNVGFALIGIAAGGREGASAVLFYMAVYSVMTLGAFLCILRLRDADGQPVEDLAAFSGLSQSQPGLAAALAFFMFSLAGLPPLFGFWPKLQVFIAAVHSGLIALAVLGIIGTVVGGYYYLRVVKILYFDAPTATLRHVKAPLEGALILLAALFVSPLGYLLIGPIGRLTGNAASSLF
ncbi:MAG: NADH-quinone oxidoreductase subunit NuoN [Sphingomicrobium sp.]|nr:NADH-quinone oxidoreductase subunit NuoN [Sphingomonadales bacterium]